MLRTRLAVILAAIAVVTFFLAWHRALPKAAPAVLQDSLVEEDSVVSLLVRFGVNDTEPQSWDGSIAVSGGEMVMLRNWHPRPGDEILGKTGWRLSTRKGINFNLRPWEVELSEAPRKYLLIPGVVVEVRNRPAAALRLTTPAGEFSFSASDLRPAVPQTFLDGRVEVQRVPRAHKLSGDDYQDDFATLLALPGGELWAAWVAYREGGNQILARRFDGSRWEPAVAVTPGGSDIFLVKLGRDGENRPWAVWSAQVDGNWDLYASRWQGGTWLPAQRLSEDPQPDIFPNLATDSNGTLWLVWQGFRNGKSDIYARRLEGGSWAAAQKVSTSPANDWEPALATDGNGNVYVAWDTYDKGNYDVMLRRHASGKWEEVQPVADSQRFEAQVSLACDRRGNLWATWNESGTQWGKDSGFLVKKEATRLYQWRTLGLAVLENGRWREPVVDINQALPPALREYNDFPIVQVDGGGRIWIFFRHRLLRIQDVHNNTPAHRAAWEIYGVFYNGQVWSHPMELPFSQGRTDMRVGFDVDSRGRLVAAWPTDNRDFEDFLFQHADVYAAAIPAPEVGLAPLSLKDRVQPDLTIFPVHMDEAADLQRIRSYKIESEGKEYKIYRGDTHRHTEFSMDGNNEGSLFQTYRYALDAVDLDFVGVSEHNGSGGPDIPYINWLLQQACDLFQLQGRFTPLYGYERSVSYPNGHRNVFFAQRGVPTLPIPEEESKGETGAAMLYEYLKKHRGIAISHTSATNMGTDWRDNDPEVEPLVEIYQGDRVSAEYEGAPRAAHSGNLASAPGGFRPAGYVWNAWAKGYKLGVQASSDHLSNHISYACTLATDLSREGLLDAMRRRHSYGATDNIVLDYRMQVDGREYLQGDIIPAAREFRLWAKIVGTAPVRQIDIVRNNTFVYTGHPLKQEVEVTFVDSRPVTGDSYYYVRVIQVDEQMAWSSPIWITRPSGSR